MRVDSHEKRRVGAMRVHGGVNAGGLNALRVVDQYHARVGVGGAPNNLDAAIGGAAIGDDNAPCVRIRA